MAQYYQLPTRIEAPAGNALLNKLRADAAYCLYMVYLLVAGLFAASIYLMTHRPETVSAGDGLLALAIVWTGFLPAAYYLLTSSDGALPFLPLFGASFSVIYGITVFSKSRTPGVLDSVVISSQALELALGALALFYLGFAVAKIYFPEAVRPLSFPRVYSDSWLRTLVWILVVAHLAYMYVPAIRKLPSVESFLDPAGYFAYGLLYLLWRRKRLPWGQSKIYWFVCLPMELLVRFSSGALAQIIVFFLFFQIVIWYDSRRIPWLLILGTVAFFVPLQPVKAEYRKYTFAYGRYANLDPVGKAKLFAQLAVQYYFGDTKRLESSSDSAASSRVADIRILSFVMAQTPEPVAYWKGATLALLFSKVVPRVLWPDKPSEFVGQEFGHRYSLLAENDHSTSMNLPWLVELYANFGPLGVFLGMPLAGLAFGLLTLKFARPGMNELEFIVGATMLFRTSVDLESNLSLVAGGFILFGVALISYLRIGFLLDRDGRRATHMTEVPVLTTVGRSR
jgi:hypothetical protein